YRQLGRYLRDLIEADRLSAGAKLPATRELAATLGLSRTTVSLAYDELIAVGLLVAHVGQGTFVAARAAGAPRLVARDAEHRGFAWSGLLALRARALAAPAGLGAQRT